VPTHKSGTTPVTDTTAMSFTYDASGRQAQMTQTTSRPSPNPNSQTVFTTALTQADTYDGDGAGVRRVTT
jgi:hypothetical protein